MASSTSNIPFTPPHPLLSPIQSSTTPLQGVHQTLNTYTPGDNESLPFLRPGQTQTPLNDGDGNEQNFSVIRTPGIINQKGKYQDWEEEYERSKLKDWKEKIDEDLKGWRGGNGQPRSYYALQALPPHSFFHQPITGTIGKHLPKEIIRVDRDWSGGEICQFDTVYPMELDGRIQPNQMLSFITTLNEILNSAYSVRAAIFDNLIAIGTLWTSLIWRQSHFERELKNAEQFIQDSNKNLFNPQGLNVLSPRFVALQFLEIEYY